MGDEARGVARQSRPVAFQEYVRDRRTHGGDRRNGQDRCAQGRLDALRAKHLREHGFSYRQGEKTRKRSESRMNMHIYCDEIEEASEPEQGTLLPADRKPQKAKRQR